MSKVPRHHHPVNCSQEDMLGFDDAIGQCFSRFPTVSQRNRGGGGAGAGGRAEGGGR